MLPANRGKPVVDEARCRRVAGAGPADIQRADRKYRHADAGVVHRRQALRQIVLLRRHRHDMAAAIEQRLPARIVDELEVGAVLEHFGEAALGVDMGVDVDDLSWKAWFKPFKQFEIV